MDEPKVSWDDNVCKPIQRKGHLETYLGDVKYHMTLNAIFRPWSARTSKLTFHPQLHFVTKERGKTPTTFILKESPCGQNVVIDEAS